MLALHTGEPLRTPLNLQSFGDSLDQLIKLAKPPASLRFPTPAARESLNRELELWRNAMMRYAVQKGLWTRENKERYASLCGEVRNFCEWMRASVTAGQALHCDVYMAIVSVQPGDGGPQT